MKGDFLGFSFDGIHCSQLGITHVSSSDRYDEDLFPEVKDKTIEIPNNHGEYYYGSTYGTRSFEIDIAYDSITETQFRNIRRLFGTQKVCELIFDERPYKVYYAKIKDPIQMSYVCFDEPKKVSGTEQDGIRIVDRTTNITSTIVEASEGLDISLDSDIFRSIFTIDGNYTFTYHDSVWYYIENNEEFEVVLDNYGITVNSLDADEASFTINNTTTTDVSWEQITPWEYVVDSQGEKVKNRIYKGEGTISLVCYQPFAHQLFKIKELYETTGANAGNLITAYNNVDEWIESSGILTQNEWDTFHIDQVINTIDPYTYAIPVYNPGDLDVGFCLYIPFVNGKILPKSGNSDIIINGDTEVLVLNPIQRKGNDTGIIINTRTHLIEGVIFSQIANMNNYRKPSWQTTGNLYNEYIKMGEFPYIKRNDWKLDAIDNRPQAIYISCAQTNTNISIYYDYLYF